MLISRDPCNFRVDSSVQKPLKLIKNEWDIIVSRTEINFFSFIGFPYSVTSWELDNEQATP